MALKLSFLTTYQDVRVYYAALLFISDCFPVGSFPCLLFLTVLSTSQPMCLVNSGWQLKK